MEIWSKLADVNWLGVIVATLVSFAVGGAWYSPKILGTTWLRELHSDKERQTSSDMVRIFGLSFILAFISAVFLDILIGKDATIARGIETGFLVSLVWISTALGINFLFARRSLKLFLIDMGYFVVFYMIMGAILGAL